MDSFEINLTIKETIAASRFIFIFEGYKSFYAEVYVTMTLKYNITLWIEWNDKHDSDPKEKDKAIQL